MSDDAKKVPDSFVVQTHAKFLVDALRKSTLNEFAARPLMNEAANTIAMLMAQLELTEDELVQCRRMMSEMTQSHGELVAAHQKLKDANK